jgi:hypothetical protein
MRAVPRFSRGRLATRGLAPGSTKIAERAGAALRPAKVAERAVAVQPTEERVAERFLLGLEVVLPQSAGVELRARRALAEQIFFPGREGFSRAVVPLAWPPADPPFFLFRPAHTLLCLRRPSMKRAHS